MSTDTLQLIEKNQVVSMHYTLKDDEGSVIDSSDGQEPLTYLHGAGNIIPGLEKALVGQTVGAQLNVRVEPADAYGEPSPELVQKVDIQMFEGVDDLEPGMVFEVQGGDQQPQRILVRAVEGEEVTIDGNHPLAGVALNFSVEVLTVRDANEAEVEQGHAQ